MRIGNYFRELSDHSRFFDEKNTKARRIVFYSERDIYYQYFEGLILELLKDETLEFSYVTSDASDPLLAKHHPRMKVFFIDQLLPGLLKKLEADALIMTMPDLNKYHVKRSPGTKNHIYMFHAIVSTHLQYRKGAFDEFDTIFCVGPHHVREIRKAEEIYGLKPKTLVESGYYRLEKIYRDHQEYRTKHPPSEEKTILVAPTWGESSLLEICPDELIAVLGSMSWRAVIRPHPEFLKRKPNEAKRLAKLISKHPRLTFETDMVSDVSLHSADVLITDRSGIAFEYAFGTERPVLFVDTPLKTTNPEYKRVGIDPIEISSRKSMGVSLAPGELSDLPNRLDDLMRMRNDFRNSLATLRTEIVFNWLGSAGADRASLLSHSSR